MHIKGQIKNRPGLGPLLPDIGCGAHEHIIEQEETSLLGFDDFTALVVDRLHHVVWADQVAAAIAQKLRDRDDKSESHYENVQHNTAIFYSTLGHSTQEPLLFIILLFIPPCFLSLFTVKPPTLDNSM